jgi:hypothetical protein
LPFYRGGDLRCRAGAAGFGVAALVLLAVFLPARAGASHSQLELISTGPTGGNAAIGALLAGTSSDGASAFFATTESLVASDSDNCPLFSPPRACFDVYQRTGATTTLVSTGPNGGNGGFDSRFEGASADGSRVYFSSTEPLTSGDTDNMCQGQTGPGPCPDIYERFGGTTSLVSTGPARGNGPFTRNFAGLSDDGTRALFGASDGLSAADSDQSEDLYQRTGGATALISTGVAGGNGAFDGLLSGASADGTHVFFRTAESLVGSDTDNAGDVYERFAGATTLVSTGPSGGNSSHSSAFEGSSADGVKVFFSTEEALVAADTDSAEDIYQRSGGSTTLVSTGASGNGTQGAIFDGTTTDGSRVFFRTRSSLAGADSDSSIDLYERSGGSTALVSTGATGGSGAFDVHFAGASDDGTHVLFTTKEALVVSDTDGRLDIYERSGGSTTLVSTGVTGGNGAFDAYLADASADGSRVFFTTDESLVASDTDSLQDIYERQGSTTTLISTGPTGGNGSHVAFFAAASDDGTRVFFHTGEHLVSDDTDTFLDIYASRALTGYARPRGAAPTQVRLVPAFKSCGSANGTHGPPLAVTSCSPPVPSSAHLTVGTPDSNGQPSKLVGYVNLKTICSPPAPTPAPPCTDPGEQGDVGIEIAITDVRRQSDLSDYGGELQSVLELRMTDRLNGASLTDPATATDVPFSIPVPCMPNSDAAVGSSCNLTTTADAVLAGMVVEGKRTIWELGQVEVRDGGADGDGDTAPNTPFLEQGLFTP